MTSIYRLILQSGASMGTEYPLDKNEMVLGRDASNDLVINDPEISRRHARFVLEGTTYRIEDLGSTNGTFIRGQRLSVPLLLQPGDVITFGEKIVLRFAVSASDPNATVAAPRGTDRYTQPNPLPAAPVAAYVPPAAVNPSIAPTPTPTPTPAQYYQPIPAAPVYAQQNIPSPVYAPTPITPVTAVPKKKSKILIILLILAGLILVFCVIPMIIIDVTQSYCSLFPGITNFFTSMFFGTIGCP